MVEEYSWISLFSCKALILLGFECVYNVLQIIFRHKKRALIGSVKGFCRSLNRVEAGEFRVKIEMACEWDRYALFDLSVVINKCKIRRSLCRCTLYHFCNATKDGYLLRQCMLFVVVARPQWLQRVAVFGGFLSVRVCVDFLYLV